MQMTFPGLRPLSIKPPIKYFGGKTWASRQLIKFIPPGVMEVVSPFLGGGSFELVMTGRGIRVFGYDAYAPLTNFWQVLLDESHDLTHMLRKTLAKFGENKDELDRFTQEFSSEIDLVDAAHRFLIRANFSFNGNFRESKFRNYHIDEDDNVIQTLGAKKLVIDYDRICGFFNPLLSVAQADFRESLRRHPDTFAYCDPPYPECSAGYGDGPQYHEDFPHEDLARILHDRKSGWMLSYNNCDTVKSLYPSNKFRYVYPKWHHGSNYLNHKGNEVLIRPIG